MPASTLALSWFSNVDGFFKNFRLIAFANQKRRIIAVKLLPAEFGLPFAGIEYHVAFQARDRALIVKLQLNHSLHFMPNKTLFNFG